MTWFRNARRQSLNTIILLILKILYPVLLNSAGASIVNRRTLTRRLRVIIDDSSIP